MISSSEKLSDIKQRIEFEFNDIDTVFDTSSVNTERPNAISSYFNAHSLRCKRAIACASLISDEKTICFAVKLGLKLSKKSIETQEQFYLPEFYNFFFYSIVTLDRHSTVFASHNLTKSKTMLRGDTSGPVHACLSCLIINDTDQANHWLIEIKKQCARKKSPYPKNTYHAMVALLKRDEEALISALDNVLLEHHAKADHGRSYDYNHPESFYCNFAVLIALTAKLFCDIDVIGKLKHDKNVLRLKISDFTEGDSVDRKTKYDVPVDYMFFAKLKDLGFLDDLEA